MNKHMLYLLPYNIFYKTGIISYYDFHFYVNMNIIKHLFMIMESIFNLYISVFKMNRLLKELLYIFCFKKEYIMASSKRRQITFKLDIVTM